MLMRFYTVLDSRQPPVFKAPILATSVFEKVTIRAAVVAKLVKGLLLTPEGCGLNSEVGKF